MTYIVSNFISAPDKINLSVGHQILIIRCYLFIHAHSFICLVLLYVSVCSADDEFTRIVHDCFFSTGMMTSSNGDIFRVTDPLCGEFTGHRWIHPTKASDAELWCFFDLCLNKRLSKQSWGWWIETPSCSLWRHCNESKRWLRNQLGLHIMTLHTCIIIQISLTVIYKFTNQQLANTSCNRLVGRKSIISPEICLTTSH